MKFLIIAVGVLFCLQSCCYKKDCPDGDKIYGVYLHGFGSFNDTVYFHSFEPRTNFSQKSSDSFAVPVHGYIGQSFLTASLPKQMDITKDWIIDVGKVKQFKFKDARTRRETCTSCIITGNDYFNVLEYTLDDEHKAGNGALELYK